VFESGQVSGGLGGWCEDLRCQELVCCLEAERMAPTYPYPMMVAVRLRVIGQKKTLSEWFLCLLVQIYLWWVVLMEYVRSW